MLRDAACLAGNYIRVADIVEKRGFAVVDMTHHGDNRRARFEHTFVIVLLRYSLDHFGADILGLESELLGNNVDSLRVETLVDAHHHTEAHTCGYDVVDRHIHHRGKVIGGNELRELEHLAFSCLQLLGLALAVCHSLTFFLAPFNTFFLTLVLAGEACECLLDLLLHILFAHLDMRLVTVSVSASAA